MSDVSPDPLLPFSLNPLLPDLCPPCSTGTALANLTSDLRVTQSKVSFQDAVFDLHLDLTPAQHMVDLLLLEIRIQFSFQNTTLV